MSYKSCETAPLVIGGVYEKVKQNGLKVRVLIINGYQAVSGTWRGEARPYEGQPFEMQQGTETMAGWDLVAAPAELEAPILSDNLETTALRALEKERNILQRRVEALEKKKASEKVTGKDIVKMIDVHNKTFGQVAAKLGMHHSTVRKMYKEARAEQQTKTAA